MSGVVQLRRCDSADKKTSAALENGVSRMVWLIALLALKSNFSIRACFVVAAFAPVDLFVFLRAAIKITVLDAVGE